MENVFDREEEQGEGYKSASNMATKTRASTSSLSSPRTAFSSVLTANNPIARKTVPEKHGQNMN